MKHHAAYAWATPEEKEYWEYVKNHRAEDGPLKPYSYDGTHYIVLNVTVVNSSEEAVGIRTDDCYVNGWKIGAGFQTSLEPGMKTKDTITIYKVDEDAEVEKLEDLEDIKIAFLTFNANTFMTKTMDITTTLTF